MISTMQPICLDYLADAGAGRYEQLIEWERRALAEGYSWPE